MKFLLLFLVIFIGTAESVDNSARCTKITFSCFDNCKKTEPNPTRICGKNSFSPAPTGSSGKCRLECEKICHDPDVILVHEGRCEKGFNTDFDILMKKFAAAHPESLGEEKFNRMLKDFIKEIGYDWKVGFPKGEREQQEKEKKERQDKMIASGYITQEMREKMRKAGQQPKDSPEFIPRSQGSGEGLNSRSKGSSDRFNPRSKGSGEGLNSRSKGSSDRFNLRSKGSGEGLNSRSKGSSDRFNPRSQGSGEGLNSRSKGSSDRFNPRSQGSGEGFNPRSKGSSDRFNPRSQGSGGFNRNQEGSRGRGQSKGSNRFSSLERF